MTPIEIAASQLGTTEDPKGSNQGKMVNEYLKAIGLGGGYSWCMAFVYWCFKQSSIGTDHLVKTGGCLRQWNEIKTEFKVVHPQRGDIFIMDFGKGKGHTGLVTSVEGDYIHTIEGNSDASGSRTGGSVCLNKRPIRTIKGFIRIEQPNLIT
jgi:hypothetical protein